MATGEPIKAGMRSSAVFATLRKKAEQLLGEQGRPPALPAEEGLDLMRLAHELEVQYVELELQNEELRRTAKEMESSRNAFAELYQSAPVGFITLDEHGVIEQVNAAAARILSNPHHILIGRFFGGLIAPGDQSKFYNLLTQKKMNGMQAPFDARLSVGRDSVVHVEVHAMARSEGAAGDLRWRLALVEVTARRQYEQALETARMELEGRVRERTAELERRSRQLARLTSQLTLAEQRERRRLAEVLHDNLQQILVGARLNLDMLGQANDLSQAQGFKETHGLIVDALHTARNLSAELSPPVLYLQGLSAALEWLGRWMLKAHNLEVIVEADPAADPAREDLKVLLFQSVRELLFNVVKYAGVDTARVRMTREGGRTTIVVADQGTGFDPRVLWRQHPTRDGGFGLFNIRERLALLNGEFDIASSAQGTTATLSLALEPWEPPPESTGQRQPAETAARTPPTATGRIRIMLVDDHAMMRKGLSMLLSSQKDMEIAGEAEDGRQAIDLARRIRPDVILMDINMPVINGLEATRQIIAELPGTRIIALSMHQAEDQARAMREAGASDYLNKSGSAAVLIEAVRRNAGSTGTGTDTP